MGIDGERVGLALGSGAARGWAHIGVIRGLEEAGIKPEIVCGSSIGSVVGAAYATGKLDRFEDWVRRLDWRQVASYFDVTLRGGIIRARKVFDAMAEEVPDQPIENLALPFAAVATDLTSGHEVWFRDGSLYDALRASVALPGFVTPAKVDGRWLVDGGLVNPVPVSLCRALGADTVIAVDLNTTLVGRRATGSRRSDIGGNVARASRKPRPGSVQAVLQDLATELRERLGRDETVERDAPPSIYEVIANSVNIMQVRITRSRMSGDPADLLVAPQLGDFALLDFDRAAEAITLGRRAVHQALRESPYYHEPKG